MAKIETWFNQDLKKPVAVHYLDGNVFSQDNNGNIIGVNVFSDGQAATLGGTVSASIIRADGATVAATGTLSGNKAYVALPQSAYYVPGVLSVVIKLTDGNDVTTLCAVVANVYMSSTDTVIDPGTIIPSIETLIAEIDAAIASIPADYSSLWTSLAPTFSADKSYAIGEYVTYDGAVYKFIKDHSGSWSGSDVITANLAKGIYEVSSGVQNALCGTAKSGNVQIPIYALDGYIDSSTGTVHAGPYKYSQPIPVVPGTVIKYISGGSGSTFELAMYATQDGDADLNESIPGKASSAEQSAIVPHGINYVRLCYPQSMTGSPYIRLCLPREGEIVVKGGFNQVNVANLQGFREDGNINKYVTLYDTGRYIDTSVTDHLVLAAAVSSYKLYLVPIQEGVTSITIAFPGESVDLRVAFLDDDLYTYTRAPSHNAYTGYATLQTSGAKYIMYNYAGDSFYGISAGSSYSAESKYYTPEWFIQSVKDAQQSIVNNKKKSVSVDANSVGVLKIGDVQNGIKKGVIVTGEAFVSAFTSVDIGFTNGNTVGTDYVSKITVNASKAIFQNKNGSPTEFTHGLTITNYLKIRVSLAYGGALTVSLYSDSGSYTFTTEEINYDFMYPFFDTTNATVTYTKLSFTCSDFDKKYWFFGDSYFSDIDSRWMHYYNYKQLSFIDGYPGEGSANAIQDLQRIIEYGNPEVIVWCMGMNDGSDTNENTPSASWAAGRDALISLCQTKGVRIVFGTVPTVPSVNNEGKNKWIRESGYTYIDFAKAVGASSTGVWYPGMISSDYVHPSAQGAIALASQVYVDFPDGAVE